MRNVIEYTQISVDGIVSGTGIAGFAAYRDDVYMRDGLSQLLACDAMVMGRTTYELFAQLWPRRSDPWAVRVNTMPKYVFSSKLETAAWSNTTIVRGDVVAEMTRLKQQEGQDLMLYGHGLLGATLLEHHMIDLIDLAIHPLVVGHGLPWFREGAQARLQLLAIKTFSKGIVKHTYAPQYD